MEKALVVCTIPNLSVIVVFLGQNKHGLQSVGENMPNAKHASSWSCLAIYGTKQVRREETKLKAWPVKTSQLFVKKLIP